MRLPTGRSSFFAREFAVSSTHYLASIAGETVFRTGGNAIDAGVAAGIALNVLERDQCDFGGVAPIIVYRPGMTAPEVIDGLGMWPAGLPLPEFLRRYSGDMPLGVPTNVTPGAPGAWLTALARHGTRSLAEILEPAISLAEGFPIHQGLAESLRRSRATIAQWPTTSSVFLRQGETPAVGEILVQEDLASFFRRLADIEADNASMGREGAIGAVIDAIYRGDIAKEIVAFTQEEGGALSDDDMARHIISVEPPVHSTYRGIDVYTCGPWSQGPLVPMILNLLEEAPIHELGFGTGAFFHYLTEAIKLACADREGYFGDPRHIDVPIRGLLSKEYAAQRRLLIGDRAFDRLPPPGDPWRYEGREGSPGYVPHLADLTEGRPRFDTGYVCAMDSEGNAFSATPSDSALEGPLVPGLGFPVSTRGSQLFLDPAHPSAIAPSKRPRLTPNPALLMQDGRALMVFGCPGGDSQAQSMAQVAVNILDFGLAVQAAIEAPRVVSMSFPETFYPHAYMPGRLIVESRLGQAVVDDLVARGHRVEVQEDFTMSTQPRGHYTMREAHPWHAFTESPYSGVCAILRRTSSDAKAVLEGGADPRRESYVAGW